MRNWFNKYRSCFVIFSDLPNGVADRCHWFLENLKKEILEELHHFYTYEMGLTNYSTRIGNLMTVCHTFRVSSTINQNFNCHFRKVAWTSVNSFECTSHSSMFTQRRHWCKSCCFEYACHLLSKIRIFENTYIKNIRESPRFDHCIQHRNKAAISNDHNNRSFSIELEM